MAARHSIPESPFKVHVANISKETNEGHIGEFFSENGCDVSAVEMLKNRGSLTSRCIAFVDLADAESLRNALLLAGHLNPCPIHLRTDRAAAGLLVTEKKRDGQAPMAAEPQQQETNIEIETRMVVEPQQQEATMEMGTQMVAQPHQQVRTPMQQEPPIHNEVWRQEGIQMQNENAFKTVVKNTFIHVVIDETDDEETESPHASAPLVRYPTAPGKLQHTGDFSWEQLEKKTLPDSARADGPDDEGFPATTAAGDSDSEASGSYAVTEVEEPQIVDARTVPLTAGQDKQAPAQTTRWADINDEGSEADEYRNADSRTEPETPVEGEGAKAACSEAGLQHDNETWPYRRRGRKERRPAARSSTNRSVDFPSAAAPGWWQGHGEENMVPSHDGNRQSTGTAGGDRARRNCDRNGSAAASSNHRPAQQDFPVTLHGIDASGTIKSVCDKVIALIEELWSGHDWPLQGRNGLQPGRYDGVYILRFCLREDAQWLVTQDLKMDDRILKAQLATMPKSKRR